MKLFTTFLLKMWFQVCEVSQSDIWKIFGLGKPTFAIIWKNRDNRTNARWNKLKSSIHEKVDKALLK